jgi:hypothetical protein
VSVSNSRQINLFLTVAGALFVVALALVGSTRLSVPPEAKAAGAPTPTVANSKGDCPSYQVDQTAFELFGLSGNQRSFIEHAVHEAQPQDRNQLHWAVLSGRAVVFMRLEGWSPQVVLAYEPSIPEQPQ